MSQKPLDGREWKVALDTKNTLHTIGEYARDLKVLQRYLNRGFLTIEEAINHIGNQVEKLEGELTRND